MADISALAELPVWYAAGWLAGWSGLWSRVELHWKDRPRWGMNLRVRMGMHGGGRMGGELKLRHQQWCNRSFVGIFQLTGRLRTSLHGLCTYAGLSLLSSGRVAFSLTMPHVLPALSFSHCHLT